MPSIKRTAAARAEAVANLRVAFEGAEWLLALEMPTKGRFRAYHLCVLPAIGAPIDVTRDVIAAFPGWTIARGDKWATYPPPYCDVHAALCEGLNALSLHVRRVAVA